MKGESWGRYPKPKEQVIENFSDNLFSSKELSTKSFLSYGMGRSYGDSCLNEGGVLVSTSSNDRFLSFDSESGVLEAQAGLSLKDLISFVLPRGWFIPVSPGTQYVSLGGAVANDIHGKNHHCGGTFGNHVLSFYLLRSDGELLRCSPKENSNLFNATIGGLGLTCLLYTSPSPRDATLSRMPSSA